MMQQTEIKDSTVKNFEKAIKRSRVFKSLFNSVEKLFGYPWLKRRFMKRTGYRLNLKSPQTFSEKLHWKKINDRNPLLPVVADKYRVREYLKKVLGQKEAEAILIPLLYFTEQPETIPFDELPQEYIIKANHGSGRNAIVEKGKPINRAAIIATCRDWMKQDYGFFKQEWAYQEIPRKIIVEPLLRDSNGELPADFKFHLFHGECQLVQVIWDRPYGKANTKEALYDINWNYLNEAFTYQAAELKQPPSLFSRMIKLSERLAAGFDYIRIDLYQTEDCIKFGEMTHYPQSGTLNCSKSFDLELGSKWYLDVDR